MLSRSSTDFKGRAISSGKAINAADDDEVNLDKISFCVAFKSLISLWINAMYVAIDSKGKKYIH